VEASEDLIQTTVERIAQTASRERGWRRQLLKGLAATLAVAILLLVGVQIWIAQMSANTIDLVLLGQSELLAAAHSAFRIQLFDRRTSRPLANVPVTVALTHRLTQESQVLANLNTDANGNVEPRFLTPDWKTGDCDLVVTAAAPGGTEELKRSIRLRRSWQVMLSSDKPVYQPGQTIMLRSLALRRPDLKPMADQETVFTIVDPKNNVIFKQEGRTEEHGLAAAECPLADELIEGAYIINCKVGDTNSKIQVQVQKYVLPRFKIALKTDRPFYQPGDTVHLTVQADYFFGKPVTNSAVEVHSPNAPAVKKNLTTVRTNNVGQAEIEFALPEDLLGPNEDVTKDLHLAFNVKVTDPGNQVQTSSIERIVTNVPVRVALLPENGTLVAGMPNTVYVVVTRADGSPVAARLIVTGVREELRSDERGLTSFVTTPKITGNRCAIRVLNDDGEIIALQYQDLTCGSEDFLVRPSKAVYRGGEALKLSGIGSGNQPIYVDLILENGSDRINLLSSTLEMQAGKGELTVDLPPELSGTIQLYAYRLVNGEPNSRATRVIYVEPANSLRIKTTLDRKEYKPGERAQLTMQLTDQAGKAVPGAISLAAVDEAVFAVLGQMPGTESTFFTAKAELLAPVQQIYPWRPESRPGTAGPQRDRIERALFSATARSSGPEGPGHRKEEPKWRSVAFPSHSLTADSYPQKVADVEKTRSAWFSRIWVAWGLMLVLALVTGEFALWGWFPARNVMVGHLFALLLVFFAIIFISTLGRNYPESFEAVGMAVGRAERSPARRATALALSVDDSESLAVPSKLSVDALARRFQRIDVNGVPEAPEEPVRIREQFPETLLWRPILITDAEGKAPLNIELADSITTWRLTASAVSTAGQLGSTSAPMKVFQPFFVSLNLPIALTRGDEVSIPVVVYNYLDQQQTITLKLADDGWFERKGGAEHKLDLQPGEVRSTNYRIKAVKVGEQQLLVEARGQKGAADAIRKNIEVVPDGRRKLEMYSGSLQEPADLVLAVPKNAIEGSTRAYLKIYPSSFSQVVEGLENIFRLPNGCFEQTSSSTYPNVLALDYLTRTGQSKPQIEAQVRHFIQLGYQRLLTFEAQTGGFDWFPHGNGNVSLTAFGLMEFTDMAKVHPIDPALLKRTRDWLLSNRDAEGTWNSDGRLMGSRRIQAIEMARLANTAYVAWAVFGYGDKVNATGDVGPTRSYLLSFNAKDLKDPYLVALMANALLGIDPSGQDAALYLERLESLKSLSADGKHVSWHQDTSGQTLFYGTGIPGEVETTALATLALFQSRQFPGTARQALEWIISHKDPQGTWHSTQATVLGLKAILAGSAARPAAGERRFTLKIGDHDQKEIRIAENQVDVLKQIDLSPDLQPGINRVFLTEESKTAAGYSLAFRYHQPEPERANKEAPYSIDLTYEKTKVEVNDLLAVTVQGRNQSKRAAAMVMVELPIPAGFVPVTDDLAALVTKGTAAKFQLEGNRILLYLRGLDPKAEPLQLKYRLQARMPVQIQVPAARVYEYYAPERQGQSGGVALVVTARP
jgi:uncharacterized protein YfaS (alpha-2-macroglobulin family)